MKCNRDCLNCIYDNCIDDYDHEKYMKNRQKYIARAIQWQKDHPERNREIKKKYYAKYIEKHREERKQYFKERYRRLKAEREKSND